MGACSTIGGSIVDLAPEINATWDNSTLALAVGDVVTVTFPFKPEWNHEARVRPDGTASFLLVDSVHVAGITTAALDDRLSQLYKLRTTSATEGIEVTVAVPTSGGAVAAASDGRSVYVVGEVAQPGALPVVGRSLTLFEAIANAGGHLKQTANLRAVVLVRRVVSTGEMRSWQLNADIYSWGQVPAIMLQARDVVFVPNTAVDDVNIWIDQYIRLMLPFPSFTPTQSF
jgi:protein involved in polysaccharide export with SLBB domain